MPKQSPSTTLDARYSEEDATATPWPEAASLLEKAGLFWVSTVRADGRPHVTPVVGVWLDGALYFSSGPGEQKSKNLAANRQCAVTTGCNTWDRGFDIVLQGEAVVVRDLALLQRVADASWPNTGTTGLSRSPVTALSAGMGCRWSTSWLQRRGWALEKIR